MEGFASILLILVGLWALLAPQSVWFSSEGWKFKNAEPSNMYLVFARVVGAIFLGLGVVIGVTLITS